MRIRRTSAAFALLTAAFVLGAQLAETAHVEAEHVVCPEHGELVHGGAPSGTPSQNDAVTGLESHEGHEAHCAHAFAAPHVVAEATTTSGPAPRVELNDGPFEAPRAPIALLHLAPKSSPPGLA